jgi:hypothetical protein
MTKCLSDSEMIHTYTRAQAIADGVLVDVSEWASPREIIGGLAIPVAMTAAVWTLLQAPDESGASLRGRAHDVLWMAAVAARRHPQSDRVTFAVRIADADVSVWLHVGLGAPGVRRHHHARRR